MTEHGELSSGDYTSTVIAPMQLILGVASGVAIAVVIETLQAALWPVAIVLFLAAAATGWYLAPVTMHVDDRRITIGQGRRERDPLVIYTAEVRDAALRTFTWAQCLGFGIDDDERTTRLAVRPGVTLQLLLHDGQRLLISVSDGPGAVRAITGTPDVIDGPPSIDTPPIDTPPDVVPPRRPSPRSGNRPPQA